MGSTTRLSTMLGRRGSPRHFGAKRSGHAGVASSLRAHFCRGQRVTLAVTTKAALVRPAPASPPRRRERRRSARPDGPADQAAATIWAHFHLGGPPPGPLVAVTRRAVRDGAPPAGIVERVVAEGPSGSATNRRWRLLAEEPR